MLKSEQASILGISASLVSDKGNSLLSPVEHVCHGQVKLKPQGSKRFYSELSSPKQKPLLPRKQLKTNENLYSNNNDDINNQKKNNSTIETAFEPSSRQPFIVQVAQEKVENNSKQINQLSSKENLEKNPVQTDPISFIPEDELYLVEQPERVNDEIGILDCIIRNNEKVLVLDLDNTLIHSTIGSLIGSGSYQIKSDQSINLIPTSNDQYLMIKRRAFLEEFLELAFKNFNVVMYTLGSVTYAKAVHELFKQSMPNLFSEFQFLRIISQSPHRSPSAQQNVTKDISRYFSFENFSHRLLVIDDNSAVYSEEWQKNIILTKPFRFWIQGDTEATINRFQFIQEDQFLFFAHRLISKLLHHDLSSKSIANAYAEHQATLLEGEIIQFPQTVNQNVCQIALSLGAQISFEQLLIPPTTIIINEHQDDQTSNQSKQWNVVTDEWLTYSYLFALNIPKEIWHLVKTLPNLETAMASLLSKQ